MTARTTASPSRRVLDEPCGLPSDIPALCTLSTKLERVAAQRRGEVARRRRTLLSTCLLSATTFVAGAGCASTFGRVRMRSNRGELRFILQTLRAARGRGKDLPRH